jgi:hypothetical protein
VQRGGWLSPATAAMAEICISGRWVYLAADFQLFHFQHDENATSF